jgi:hypothetical protein
MSFQNNMLRFIRKPPVPVAACLAYASVLEVAGGFSKNEIQVRIGNDERHNIDTKVNVTDSQDITIIIY